MKKLFCVLISVIAVISAALGLSACYGAQPDPDAYSFITVDINPSVELIALGNEVQEVKAANYDACVLLEGEDFSALSVEDATAKIVALADELGYLTDTNNEVRISVLSDNSSTAEVLKNAAKSGAEKGSKKAVAVARIDEEKERLIASIMEHDPTMTYELGEAATVKELATLLKAAIKEHEDVFTAELREEYSALYSVKKIEIERAIAAVYGEEYLGGWEVYTAVETIYNGIVNRLAKTGLSEDDVAAVLGLLGITDSSLVEKGGVVRPEYVLAYVDKHVVKKSEQSVDVDAVMQIIAKYDVDEYVLSEAELAALSEALGESVTYSRLSEVKDALAELGAALQALKSEISLSDEQLAQIRELEESFGSIRQSVLDEMSEDIAAVRAEIAAEKSERTNH